MTPRSGESLERGDHLPEKSDRSLHLLSSGVFVVMVLGDHGPAAGVEQAAPVDVD